jgi:hypothetical protein
MGPGAPTQGLKPAAFKVWVLGFLGPGIVARGLNSCWPSTPQDPKYHPFAGDRTLPGGPTF